MPTITAFGVPQTAFLPLWLFRQTIFIGCAGGVGAAAWFAVAAGARAAFDPAEGPQAQSVAQAKGGSRQMKPKRDMAGRV